METNMFFYSTDTTYLNGKNISLHGTRYKNTKWFIFQKPDGYYIGYVNNDSTYNSILHDRIICNTPIEDVILQGAYQTKRIAEYYIYIYVHHEKLI